jgi:hypothetical protein
MTWNDQYSSFLLRFRRVQNDDSPTWVVTVQNTKTSQQLWFSSLDGLIQYLQAEFGSAAQPVSASLPEALETPVVKKQDPSVALVKERD